MSAYSSFSADNFEFEAVSASADDSASRGVEQVVLTGYTSGQGVNGVVSAYNIEIVFTGEGWTEELQQNFIVASEYLSTLITGDVPNQRRGGIDDIRITATITDIDGEGGVLGQAGPTATRFQSKLPTTAIMEFDTADAQDFQDLGLFDDIVLHEMMHTLGFGTIWSQLGLTTGSVRAGNIVFNGDNAILAYNTEFAAIAANDPNAANGVPVETQGGSGTAGGHWDEDTFINELMTGFIDDANYISSMTVASFEDMGYATVFDSSNPTADIIQLDEFANSLFA